MNRSLFFTGMMLMYVLCISAQEINTKTMDERLGRMVLTGYCNREGLQQDDFGDHFLKEYNAYQPEKKVLKKMKKLCKEVSITIVLGTWCGDSREQVPRFFRLLDQLKYPESELTMICLNRDKKTNSFTIENLHIERVPTFIFYQKGTEKEIGRIIETPSVTLESDMLGILEKSNVTH